MLMAFISMASATASESRRLVMTLTNRLMFIHPPSLESNEVCLVEVYTCV